MERQDLTQASAAFWILKASWQVRNGEKIRIIERALMREASIVAFAAYESTQAAIAAPAASTSTDAMGVRIELLRLEGIPFGQLTPEQQGRKIELLRISK
jgi:phage head maturation protease